jgi:2-dehydro-3-deoxyphosphogluconate aldolase / (4S)-4-hydroxy-2-oxoglutarate aldolase
MNDIAAIMRLAPVIPVLTVERVADARPIAEALVAGGLRALEVTLRTPAALDVIRAMKDVEGAVVGAGTVLSPRDLDAAFEAGARFIVSPGLTERVAEEARIAAVPLLPGVATATEVMRGLDLGLAHFKFFPAEQAGGVAMLKAFAGPFAEARFCPTGGVTQGNAANYLGLPNVLCVGGSWIATPELIAAGAWAEITDRARAAKALR